MKRFLIATATQSQSVRKQLVLLAAAVMLLAASCGGNGEDSSNAPSSSNSQPTGTSAHTTTIVEAGLSKDEAKVLADTMLLRLADFPSGWRATNSDQEDERCASIGEVSDRFDVLAKSKSPTFAHGEATQVESRAGILPNEETAKQVMNFLEGAIQSDEFRKCLDDFFKGQADPGVTVGELQVGQLSFPRLGDRSSAWQIVIPFKSEGVELSAYLDVIYVQKGKAVGQVFYLDVLSPFEETLKQGLGRRVAERMAAAQD